MKAATKYGIAAMHIMTHTKVFRKVSSWFPRALKSAFLSTWPPEAKQCICPIKKSARQLMHSEPCWQKRLWRVTMQHSLISLLVLGQRAAQNACKTPNITY